MSLIVQLGTVVASAIEEVGTPQVVEVQTSMGTSDEPEPMEASVPPEADDDVESKKNKSRSTKYSAQIGLPYHSVLQDHNYGAPPPPTPPLSPLPVHHSSPPKSPILSTKASAPVGRSPSPVHSASQNIPMLNVMDEDSRASIVSSIAGDPEPEGEETETAPEGEGEEEDSVTRCVCDFEHDDGYMICCDKCSVWQHVDCMGIDRSNIPDEYMCEQCQPRKVDRHRARTLQLRKREELNTDSSSSDSVEETVSVSARRRQTQRKSEPKRVRKQRKELPREQKVRERRANKRRESKVDSKRTPTKRRTKRKMTVDQVDEETQDSWDHATMQLRQWIDNYEEAVTNHYSPELRARIGSIKVNGIHSDFRTIHGAAKCRTNLLEPGVKILLSTSNLSPNQPIIEIRGKYMLATQYRQQALVLSKRYPPFIFFYQLPKDGAEVCVDARTYGNDARFIRRSCKPNAEVRHCIEKGTLHLYIVASTSIDRNAEITVPHDQKDIISPSSCACNSKLCTAFVVVKKNGFTETERDRRRRGRRTTSSEDGEPPPSIPNLRRSAPKSPTKIPPPIKESADASRSESECDTASEKRKMTREERKMEAIMKAFERLEKAEQRKQEVLARQAQKKDHDSPKKEDEIKKEELEIEEEKPEIPKVQIVDAIKPIPERPRRKGKKGRGRTSTPQRRRSRVNSGESDITSPEEGPVMNTVGSQLIPPQSLYPAVPNSLPQTPSANVSSTPTTDSGSSAGSEHNTPLSVPTLPPLSAGIPLTPGFKFPKTKKVLMNEWLNKSTDPVIQHCSTKQGDGCVGNHCERSTRSNSLSTPAKITNPRRASLGAAPSNRGAGGVGTGSAKKRWLRQAISEESDSPGGAPYCSSPNSRAGSPPCSDYVTPLKKRRLARESMSSEQSFTPPTTPASDADVELPGVVSSNSPSLQQAAESESEDAKTNFIEVALEEDEDEDEDDTRTCVSPEPQVEETEIKEEPADSEVGESDSLHAVEGHSQIGTGGGKDVEAAEIHEDEKIPIKEEEEEEEEEEIEMKPALEADQQCTDRKKFEAPTATAAMPESSEQVEAEAEQQDEEEDDPGDDNCCEESEDYGDEDMDCKIDNGSSNNEDGRPSSPEQKDNSPNSRQPTKRKLSITEYRKRKMSSQTNEEKIENKGGESPSLDKSSSSEKNSDDESVSFPSVTLTPLPLFENLEADKDDKKGTEEKGGSSELYMRWNSAPTMVERQRENLTERLRREFGLFLSDDEEDKSKMKGQPEAKEKEKEKPHKSSSKDLEKKSSKGSASPPPPPPDTPPPRVPAIVKVLTAVYAQSTQKSPLKTLPPGVKLSAVTIPTYPPNGPAVAQSQLQSSYPRQNGPFTYPAAHQYATHNSTYAPGHAASAVKPITAGFATTQYQGARPATPYLASIPPPAQFQNTTQFRPQYSAKAGQQAVPFAPVVSAPAVGIAKNLTPTFAVPAQALAGRPARPPTQASQFGVAHVIQSVNTAPAARASKPFYTQSYYPQSRS